MTTEDRSSSAESSPHESSSTTRRAFIAATAGAGFAAAVQPVGAQTIHTDAKGLAFVGDVKIPGDKDGLTCYLARPEGNKKFPLVIVVYEIFGVHEYIKDVCRRLAKMGYVAVAPNLFGRQGDVSKETDINRIIANVVSKVPDEQVMKDLDATIRWAEKEGGAQEGKVAMTGFCWGGRVTWLYAAHNPRLKAGVAWYGRLVGDSTPLQPTHPVDVAAKLKTPVLGLYGGADTGIPLTTVEKMREALKAAPKNVSVEIVVFPEAPHAFHADYRPSYRPEPAQDAWKRMNDWFVRFL